MRVYAFERTAGITKNEVCRFGSEHVSMWHGKGHRNGKTGLRERYGLESELLHPLCVTRSGAFVPEIWMPMFGELVASERLMQRLNEFPNLRFLKVRFEKVVDLIVKKGDMHITHSYLESGQPDIDDLFAHLSDEPLLRANIGCHYEVICERLTNLVAKCHPRNLKVMQLSIDPSTDDEMDIDVRVDSQLFLNYPLIQSGVAFLCRAEVFRLLDPHLDRDYFRIGYVDLD